MKGMILDKGQEYFTNFQIIFKNLNGFHKQFNWLVTDSFTCALKEEHAKLSKGEPLWMSGEDLDKIVMSEEFQWVSAVLSGFKKEISKEDVFKYSEPMWDSANLWENPVSIQHPLAEIEIVPWDGALLLFISKDDKYALLFKEKFPDAQDLEEHNKEIYDNNNPI